LEESVNKINRTIEDLNMIDHSLFQCQDAESGLHETKDHEILVSEIQIEINSKFKRLRNGSFSLAKQYVESNKFKIGTQRKCLFCKLSHETKSCKKVLSWTLEERKDRILEAGVCSKCLVHSGLRTGNI